MIYPYLLSLLVKSLLVVGGTAVAMLVLRRSSAAVRCLVLRVGMVALLALPVLSAILPAWTLRLLPASPAPAEHAATLGMAVPAPSPAPDYSWLLALYALGVAIGLMRLVAALGAAAVVVRNGIVVERRRGFRIMLAEGAPMPFAYGHVRPTVVLPAGALDWENDLREDVIAHEAAHIRRRDWAWLVLSRVVGVFYWPNVGVAWLLHRLRIEAEVAADDLVLAGGQDHVVYAEHLVRVARSCQSTALLAPMAAEPPLTTRLRALLHGGTRRHAPGRASAHAAFIFAMLMAAPLAALGFAEGKPAVGAPTVEIAQTAVDVTAVESVTVAAPFEAVETAPIPSPDAVAIVPQEDTLRPARAPRPPRRWRAVNPPTPVATPEPLSPSRPLATPVPGVAVEAPVAPMQGAPVPTAPLPPVATSSPATETPPSPGAAEPRVEVTVDAAVATVAAPAQQIGGAPLGRPAQTRASAARGQKLRSE
ncbi:MAG: M56 family metallopeptidase [Fimbriimonas sp.]